MDDDIPRYRKKRGGKPPKKANHKHEYEPVVFEYMNKYKKLTRENGFVEGTDYCAGSKCKVCGRLQYGFPKGYYKAHPPQVTVFGSLVVEDYPDLPVVKVKDIWSKDLEEE